MASAAEQLAANINWSAFSKAEELKKRIWFTLGALVVFRLGTYIPLPGIDSAAFEAAFNGQKQGVLDMFNMFSGGAVQRMAVFALNIMPYISASIIIQLLSSVIPQLEAIKKEGEQGRKVLNQYTRYLTVVLAVFQAYGQGLCSARIFCGSICDPFRPALGIDDARARSVRYCGSSRNHQGSERSFDLRSICCAYRSGQGDQGFPPG